MANAANLINFGGSALAVGDWTYSAYPLSAPAYLPLTDDTASYLTSSYPTLGATYAPTTVAYSATSKTLPFVGSVSGLFPWNFLFGNKTFFGWNGFGNFIVSTDLTTWYKRAIPVTATLERAANSISAATALNPYSGQSGQITWAAVAYGGGKLSALRNGIDQTSSKTGIGNGVAMSQDNGVTWTFATTPYVTNAITSSVAWTSLIYAQGSFAAYGYQYDAGSGIFGVFATSSDGLNYTVVRSNIYTNNTLTRIATVIAYGNGIYLLFVKEETSVYVSTNNGSTWTLNGTNNIWTNSVAYGAGVFVAVGTTTAGAATNIANSSPDGVTWTQRTLPATQTWTSVTYANGYFIAIGTTGAASTVIASSPDGTTWTSRTVPSSTNRYGVAGGDNKFVYQNNATGATITQIDLSTSASSFTLPMITTPLAGTQAFIKAT